MIIRNSRFSIEKKTVVYWCLCLFFVLSIFEQYVNQWIGSMTKYYIFFIMFVILWRDGYKLRINKISIAYILWLGIKLTTLLWSEDYTVPKLHLISQIGMVMFLVVLLSREYDKEFMTGMMDVYWAASVVLGILSIFFSSSYRGTQDARLVLVLFGAETDPNNQAALLLVGVATSLYYLFYEKRKKGLFAAGLIINCFACLQTSSRAGMVALGALAVFCVLCTPKKQKLGVTLRNLVLLCVVMAMLYYVVINWLPEESFGRLFDFSSYEGGSGRIKLWTTTWRMFSRDPLTILFGIGWGSILPYLNGYSVHNTFLAMLCNVGLVGTLLFMVPIAVTTLRLLKRMEPMPVLHLIAQLVPAFFIEAINKRFFWNAIFILFLYYYQELRTFATEER